jgi:hypothetical protein
MSGFAIMTNAGEPTFSSTVIGDPEIARKAWAETLEGAKRLVEGWTAEAQRKGPVDMKKDPFAPERQRQIDRRPGERARVHTV